MTDNEKVIKGLGSCVEYFASKVKGVMFDEWLEESRKALALLKAQEPRVMTLEEVIDWDGAVLFESRKDGTEEWEFFKGTYEHGGETMCTTIEPDGDWDRWRKKLYGKTWRCWTSRPTDEQMEAEPWNG